MGRHRWWSGAYVGLVAGLAAVGFIIQAPHPILVAGALTVPASIATLPGYYIVYGVLAAVTGANPNESSGYGYSSPDGIVTVVEAGLQPAWFTITTSVLGVLMLAAGAVANILAPLQTSSCCVGSPR